MIKDFAKNVLGVSMYRYGYQTVILLSSALTSRLLSPVEYGTVALITVITGFINAFNDSGISLLIIRSDYGERLYRLLYHLSILMGLILGGVVLLLAFPISWFNHNSNLIYPTFLSAGVVLVQTFSVIPLAVLRKREMYVTRAKIEFWAHSTSTVVTIVLAYLGFSFWSLIVAQFYAAVLQLIWANYYVKVNLFNFSLKKSLLSYKMSKKTLLTLSSGTVFTYWSANAGNFVIGRFFGEALLGIYNRASSLSVMITSLIGGVLNSVMLPTLKSVEKSKDFLSFVKLVSVFILTVFAFINIVFVLFGPDIITFIWSKTWISVAEYLPYVFFLGYSTVSINFIMNLYYLKKQESLFTRITSVSSTIQIGIFLLAFIFPLRDVLFLGAIFSLVIISPLLWFLLPIKVLPEINKWQVVLMIVCFLLSAAVLAAYHYNLGSILHLLLVVYGALHIWAAVPSAIFLLNRRKQPTA